MDSNNNGKKVNVSFFGRARRVEIVEKIVYVLVGIFAVCLTIFLVTRTKDVFVDKNVDFAYLKQYLESKGFTCEMLQDSGGSCSFENDYSNYSFVRYNTGFVYILKTDNYRLLVNHVSTGTDYITFVTYDTAYYGYKNREYVCTNVDENNILSDISSCETSDGEVLDLGAYLGVVNMAVSDLNDIIDSSGYSKDSLINDYEWIKK